MAASEKIRELIKNRIQDISSSRPVTSCQVWLQVKDVMSTEVATVGDQQITEQEFNNALRQQQDLQANAARQQQDLQASRARLGMQEREHAIKLQQKAQDHALNLAMKAQQPKKEKPSK